MADYRYLAADLVTGEIRDAIPFTSVSFGQVRNGAAPFTATIEVDATVRRLIEESVGLSTEDDDVLASEDGHPLQLEESDTRETAHLLASRANLDPARTVIYIERDGRIIGDGIVWDPRLSEDGDTLEIAGASLWSYFRHRHVRHRLTWSGVDHLQIARDLIDYAQAQPGGDIGIVTGDETSDVPRDETFEAFERKNIAEAVEQHAARINGFDFRITVAWEGSGDTRHVVRRLLIGHPKLGRRTEHVFEFIADDDGRGGNLDRYGLEVAGSRVANLVDAIGEGMDDEMLIATAVDPNLFGAYPLLEAKVAHKTVKTQTRLQEHADAHLRSHRLPLELPTLVPNADAIPRLSSYIAGDEVLVRVRQGWAQLEGFWAIQAWTVNVDADGNETVRIIPAGVDAT